MKKLIILLIIQIYFVNLVSVAQEFGEVYLAYDPDSALFDNFGFSVAISGNFTIVGAPYEDEDETGENILFYAGSAFIYERNDMGDWEFKKKIVASDRKDTTAFGFSVSISGNYIVVGAPYNDTDISDENYLHYAGAAYIFERDAYGNWLEVKKIVASDRDRDDRFGYSVGISGDNIVVGAYREDEDSLEMNSLSNAGSAYIFHRDESGSWNEIQKIVASDREEGDYFGNSVSISGSYIIAGARYEDEDEEGLNEMEDPGSAYIFRLEGTRWQEVQKITAPVRGNYDHFGFAVGISGNYAIVGANLEDEDAEEENYLQYAGAAYIFERNTDDIWEIADKIVASDRNEEDEFGRSVSISGDYAVVGAPFEDEDVQGNNTLEDAGSAYVFHRDEVGNWSEIQKIVTSDRGFRDNSGCSTGISGDYLILGRGDESEFYWAGAANIYESCTPSGVPDPDNIIENGDFASCVLSPWSLFKADYLGVTLNAVLVKGECILSGITLSDNPQQLYAQLNQEFSISQINQLMKDSTYILTFDAKAQTADRPCRVSFEQRVDPWANIMYENILLGTEPETYSFEFTLTEIYPEMQLSFQVGLENSEVTFDNISMVRKIGGSTTTIAQRKGESVSVFPNPASDYLTIVTEDGACVNLYSPQGTAVRSQKSMNREISLDISSLSPGIYILEVNYSRGRSVNKVIVE